MKMAKVKTTWRGMLCRPHCRMNSTRLSDRVCPLPDATLGIPRAFLRGASLAGEPLRAEFF